MPEGPGVQLVLGVLGVPEKQRKFSLFTAELMKLNVSPEQENRYRNIKLDGNKHLRFVVVAVFLACGDDAYQTFP